MAHAAASQRGFTLIEMLVALTIMAVMAGLGWQAIDNMARTHTITSEQSQSTLRLSASMEQWTTDLDRVQTVPGQAAMAFDGLVLRLVRRDGADSDTASRGLRVVAWAVRTEPEGTRWARWQSRPMTDTASVRQAWGRAGQWARGAKLASEAGDSAVVMAPVDRWQVYFHRGGTWVNPQSAVGGAPEATDNSLPDGVRITLDGLQAPGFQGKLQRDWVQPLLIPARS